MVAMPMKLFAGVKMTFVPLMAAVPFVGLMLMIESVPPGVRRTSFASGLKVFVLFSLTA